MNKKVGEAEKEEKKKVYTLSATYKVKNLDGEVERLHLDSKGHSVKEMLNNLEMPKGMNRLVVVKVSNGDKEVEVALAPHRVRQILEFKDELRFEQYFGKL